MSSIANRAHEQGKRCAITVACGDGVGPEIMQATLHILKEAGALLDVETIELGEQVYRRGINSGIESSAWEALRRTRVLLKAPIMTPQGGGFKSLNVTIRKSMGLYANVRPCVAYAPFVPTRHPGMDLVIVRENEEDLYAGIEHRQTDDVMQCLKLITRPGSEKIVRYAFEFARKQGRKKVSCFTKDNIMKLTDGLFHKVFDEIAAEYPDIISEHLLVDIGAARLTDTPEEFDLLVLPNQYGDILSSQAAQLAGSVGLAGAANIGSETAMFEAIHGSAPDIAGKDIANPSGLLLAAIMMLNHLGQNRVAERLHNAWLRTLEEGIHTADLHREGTAGVAGAAGGELVGTHAFADAVVTRLGQGPQVLAPVSYPDASPLSLVMPEVETKYVPARKDLVGVDVFLHWKEGTPAELANLLCAANDRANGALKLTMITSRGVKVWPERFPETGCGDHWRCRFLAQGEQPNIRHADIISLLTHVDAAGLDFIKSENLCHFNGVPGYAMGQGQ